MHRLDMRHLNKPSWDTLKFLAIVLVGLSLRMFVMTLGHNYDFESHLIVGKIVSSGGNVYAETSRYNYGPIFSVILGLLYSVSSMFANPLFAYRVFIVCLLTCFDIALAYLLYKKYENFNLAALYFLNPVSIIITGYHNQFDVMAVCMGYMGCVLANDRDELFTKKDLGAIILLSLSIATKHLLSFFSLWILFNKHMPMKKRLAYGLVPISFFFISFLPYLPGGYRGILENVFMYRSLNNFPLLHLFLQRFHVDTAYLYCFVIFISLLGYYTRTMRLHDQILFYFLGLVCFSSALTNQYLAIPVLSICILGGFLKHVYFAVTGLFLVLSPNGLNLYSVYCENTLAWSFAGDMVHATGFFIAAWIIFIILLYRLLNPLNSNNVLHV
jgi:hypothetical protein